MKTFLLIALILSTFTTKASNYYFSDISGDDSRTAATAENPATPWKSLDKLNAFFITFKPGDSLLLKRGDTFFGTIQINKSGTSGAPIVIGAYGLGENPVITGMISLTFVSKGSGLWVSNEVLQLPRLNLVTVNNVPAGMGRWPNPDNGNGGYDSIRSATRSTITDNVGLTISPSAGKPAYFIGAEIVVRTTRWSLDRHPVTDYDKYSSTIKFDPSSTNEFPKANYGYFIQDDSTILDRQNEWWYNRAGKKLKIYSAQSPVNVRAANLQNLLVSHNKSYITIDNITFNGCNADAITIDDGSNLIVQNCTINNAGRNAILTDAPYCSFLNNKMADIMSKGILVNPNADHTTIKYNTIRDVGQIAGLGTSQQEDNKSSASGDGIYIKAKATIVEYNTFIKMGYAAVHLTKVDSAIIKYNFIDTVCNVFDDGGAIYSYTGTRYINRGRQISHNIMLHGIGAFYGSGVYGGSAAGAGVAGIYNDRGTSGIEEEFNTVAYFEKGILMNYGCEKIKVNNNTFYHNGNGMQINTRLKDKTRFLIINENIAIAATKSQKTLYIYSDDGDVLNLFGAIDYNFYARPISDKMTMSWQTNQGKLNTYAGNLTDWQVKFPKYDANSKKGPKSIINISEIKFEYNETSVPKVVPLNGSYIDGKGDLYSNSITLQPFASTVLMIISPDAQSGAPAVSITNPVINESFVTPATINITATAADADGSVIKVDFYNGNSLLATSFSSPYSVAWNNVAPGNYSLTARATDNSGLIATSAAVNVSVGTANVPPTVSITTPAINANFISPASINITASAADADGSVTKVEFYHDNILLATQFSSPYSFTWNNIVPGNYSLTAKATDNSRIGTTSSAVNVTVSAANVAPTVSITTPAINASFISPASINITASAADADGSVTKVEFYHDNILLATQFSSPYSFTWNNVAPGNYSLTAKATDNSRLATTSAAVNVSVGTANVAPTVSITTPSINAGFISPASINISASAADIDGSVTKVDFYNGNILLATQFSSPYSFTWNNVAPGNYSLTAKATDNSRLGTTSSAVNVSVYSANVPPTISITTPAINASFISPASINITASAADIDGSVAKVDFYNGNILLATRFSSPYSFTWNNVAPGTYSLTAKATDNGGLITSSAAINVSVVRPNVAPTVSITIPAIKVGFVSPASINIIASAKDDDGSIAKVEFYNGNILLGTQLSSPYTITWNNVAPGNYTLMAKATDNEGLATSSVAIIVSVVKPNVAPAVYITTPAINATFISPASININASASDADGSITKVEFYRDNVLLGTQFSSPYSFAWNNVAPGNYSLTAKATDNKGLFTSSSAIAVSVIKPNVAPTVSLTSPLANATFISPASISINASAIDTDGSVVRVDFFSNNILIGTDYTSPYSFTWDNVAAGNYSLTAIATDNGGLFTSSSAVTVSVIKPNAAPVVSLTSPSDKTQFTGPLSINITASAADADGSIAKVDFYNGNTLIGTDNISPYSFTWNNVAPGNYTLTARAADNKGLISSSPAITILVIKLKLAPKVSLINPLTNASFISPASINITAVASDSDGTIAKVEFYNDTTLLTIERKLPYSWSWDNVPPGNYTIIAKATDNSGLVTSSPAVTVSVIKPNVAPVVSLTSPLANAAFIAPASISIIADAADEDGAVAKVDFYNGTTLIGTDNISPYSFTWNNVAAGNYSLTAIATDNGGLLTSSSAVAVSVIKPNVAPTVSLTSPLANASFISPASISVNASAIDTDGSVVSVDFFSNNTLIGTDYTSPYSFTWNNVAAGNYSLTAIATDNGGLFTSSSAIAVSVIKPNVAPTVSLTSPLANATFISPASISINASAIDTDGSVVKVDFFSNNILIGTDYTSPYSFTWDNVAPGNYSLTAIATDNGGLFTSSSAVAVSVIKPNAAPVVSLTSPITNTKFTSLASINISAAASDTDGTISRVEFYNGTTLLTIERKLPYSWDWNDVPAGNYTLMAKAFDNSGSVTSSAAVTVSVINPNVAPEVSLSSPIAGAVYSAPASIIITAAATDSDGYIKKVEFYSDTVLLASQKMSPYTWKWQNPPAGNHLITARATDNAGHTTTSQVINITVNTGKVAFSAMSKKSNSAVINSGLNETRTADIKIGPNPARNVLSVFTKKLQKNKKLDISIISMSGVLLKKLASNTSNQVIQINISFLRAGSYQLRLQTNDTLITKQFEKL